MVVHRAHTLVPAKLQRRCNVTRATLVHGLSQVTTHPGGRCRPVSLEKCMTEPDLDPAVDYPLSVNRRDLLVTPTGKPGVNPDKDVRHSV